MLHTINAVVCIVSFLAKPLNQAKTAQQTWEVIKDSGHTIPDF